VYIQPLGKWQDEAEIIGVSLPRIETLRRTEDRTNAVPIFAFRIQMGVMIEHRI
jgi:hypothetical protein